MPKTRLLKQERQRLLKKNEIQETLSHTDLSCKKMTKEFLGMKGRNTSEQQETPQKANPQFSVDFNTGTVACKSLKDSIQRCNA